MDLMLDKQGAVPAQETFWGSCRGQNSTSNFPVLEYWKKTYLEILPWPVPELCNACFASKHGALVALWTFVPWDVSRAAPLLHWPPAYVNISKFANQDNNNFNFA